jgi:hypothetical protein
MGTKGEGHSSSLAQLAVTTAGKNRIMIFGPKDDGTYAVEFRMARAACAAVVAWSGCGTPPSEIQDPV